MSAQSSRNVARWVAILAVVLIAAAIAWLTWGGDFAGPAAFADPTGSVERPRADRNAQPPISVRTIQPERSPLSRHSLQPAMVEPYERTQVLAKASGFVEEVLVDIGDRVATGQVLLRLHIPELDEERLRHEALVAQAVAEVLEAEAGIAAADAEIVAAAANVSEAKAQRQRYQSECEYRERVLRRFERLHADGGAIQADVVDDKRNEWEAAKAALQAAVESVATAEAGLQVKQAELAVAQAQAHSAAERQRVAEANQRQAEVMMAYAEVTSPFDGIVTQREADTGAFVRSAEAGDAAPLFELVRVDPLRIAADVPEGDAAFIRVGQPATLRVDGLPGQEFQGRVARFSDSLDPATRTMRCEVELTGPTAGLRPGMYGHVDIELADLPDALLLPASALMSGEAPCVMVAEDGVCRRREVVLGLNDGVRVQIVSGLRDGDRVITSGAASLRDGQPVRVLESDRQGS